MTLNRSISGQAPWGHYGMTVWEYQRARSRVGARDDNPSGHPGVLLVRIPVFAKNGYRPQEPVSPGFLRSLLPFPSCRT